MSFYYLIITAVFYFSKVYFIHILFPEKDVYFYVCYFYFNLLIIKIE